MEGHGLTLANEDNCAIMLGSEDAASVEMALVILIANHENPIKFLIDRGLVGAVVGCDSFRGYKEWDLAEHQMINECVRRESIKLLTDHIRLALGCEAYKTHQVLRAFPASPLHPGTDVLPKSEWADSPVRQRIKIARDRFDRMLHWCEEFHRDFNTRQFRWVRFPHLDPFAPLWNAIVWC